jgi:hypothetical protein
MGQVSESLFNFNESLRGTGMPVFPESITVGNWNSCLSNLNDKSEVEGTSLLHHTNLNSLIKKNLFQEFNCNLNHILIVPSGKALQGVEKFKLQDNFFYLRKVVVIMGT